MEDLVAAKDLRPGEVLVSFHLAAQLAGYDQRRVKEARIGVGAVFPSPRRLCEVESMLMEGQPGPALWRQAAELTVRLMLDACGARLSMVYKESALLRVTASTLVRAWKGGRL